MLSQRRRARNRQRRARRKTLAVVVLLGAFVVAWLITDIAGPEKIRARTFVNGVDIGGVHISELANVLEPLQAEAAATKIELLFDGETISSTADELGMSIDVDAVIADASADRISPMVRPLVWVTDFVTRRDLEVVVGYDEDRVEAALNAIARSPETPRITSPTAPLNPFSLLKSPCPT